ncbi:unnamed protein product [Prorocentrum cordatum]|uniref:Uncharacterized protein n=1 Tax=Prorocentrum cordatum TaxID=2364126 RepID=A0ABN9WHJ4_9DINO|nr:unnamed protein product [Polarella glacialis]
MLIPSLDFLPLWPRSSRCNHFLLGRPRRAACQAIAGVAWPWQDPEERELSAAQSDSVQAPCNEAEAQILVNTKVPEKSDQPHKSPQFLSAYERVCIIGQRVLQLSMNAGWPQWSWRREKFRSSSAGPVLDGSCEDDDAPSFRKLVLVPQPLGVVGIRQGCQPRLCDVHNSCSG